MLSKSPFRDFGWAVSSLKNMSSLCFSSWKGKIVREALSTACAVVAALTQTHLDTQWLSCPKRCWQLLHPFLHPQTSHYLCCPPLTLQQPMGRSRKNQTLSKSGLSPGACTRVAVSIKIYWSDTLLLWQVVVVKTCKQRNSNLNSLNWFHLN